MKARSESEVTLQVTRRWREADEVVALELAATDGADLPAWDPGSHIDVITASGDVRQYSLCGDPNDKRKWRIGVLREKAGRGGSIWIHDKLHEGDTIVARGPRNHFRLDASPAYLFIAGGIGVTPILPMLAAAQAANANYRLIYGGRTPTTMAFKGELARFGDKAQILPQSETGVIDLDKLLAVPESDTLIYCCGPSSLLDAVEARTCHWPQGSLRMERFTAREFDAATTVDTAFQIELVRSGVMLDVPADRTILSVLEEAGIEVMSSCTQGTCGACTTAVLSGLADHRDSVLTDEERAAGDQIIVCVSRCRGERLTLDL